MTTESIIAFLEARYAQTAAAAEAARDELVAAYGEYSDAELAQRDAGLGLPPDSRPGVRCHGLDAWWVFASQYQTPSRVLADVASKRAILALHSPSDDDPDGSAYCPECERYDGTGQMCPTVKLLAAPFAGHPDFDPSWSS